MDARSVAVGAAVGVSDIAVVYPLAVVASRRESGLQLRSALRQGNLWSGWRTQSVLVPYSIMVEAGTDSIRKAFGKRWEGLAPLAASVLVGFTLQPMEKKLVVDQLLQHATSIPHSTRSHVWLWMKEYVRIHGIAALFKGVSLVTFREFIYISSITAVNPWTISKAQTLSHKESFARDGIVAFSVGFSAGMISAPVQTLNVLSKDERNLYLPLKKIVSREIRALPPLQAIERLFFGALIRSTRCGGAGLLYLAWRKIFCPNTK